MKEKITNVFKFKKCISVGRLLTTEDLLSCIYQNFTKFLQIEISTNFYK